MNGRQLLMHTLRTRLPKRKYRVLEPGALTKLETGRPVLIVVRMNVAPSPHAQLGQYEQEFDVWIVEPRQLTDAETSLDDALEDVIVAIDGGVDAPGWLTFQEAERSTYTLNVDPPAIHPAYRVRLVGRTNREEGA